MMINANTKYAAHIVPASNDACHCSLTARTRLELVQQEGRAHKTRTRAMPAMQCMAQGALGIMEHLAWGCWLHVYAPLSNLSAR